MSKFLFDGAMLSLWHIKKILVYMRCTNPLEECKDEYHLGFDLYPGYLIEEIMNKTYYNPHYK